MTEDDLNGLLRIAVVIGSVREPRLADPLAAWLESELSTIGRLDLDMIDLASVRLPMHETRPGGAAASRIADRLADADGFVLLTPEYNHSHGPEVPTAEGPVRSWATASLSVNAGLRRTGPPA